MCLIAFAWRVHPRFELALIGNRDEFHRRPTAAAATHADAPDVFGGRDLEKGGSWLLASTRGRLAAVTNVRAGMNREVAPKSRGALVDGFTRDIRDAAAFLDTLRNDEDQYGRFNLLLWDGHHALAATNHPQFDQRILAPGIYGLSNGAFDVDWPKVRCAKAALQTWLAQRHAELPPDITSLFDALHDEVPAPDADLPDTHVGIDLERRLAPPFIRGDTYGTRASSVVLVDASSIDFAERRHGANGIGAGDTRVTRPRA